jgi:negative regulator of sigma E activity
MTDRQAPLSDDELLSAYLDGELAGEELARAERLVAEQPGSRQWLAELRALGEGLRALPRSHLGEGFPERVLRKAERQLLSESQVPLASPADSSPARWRNKRPWIYAAASLAAGLLVAVAGWPHRSAEHPASDLAAGSAGEADRGVIDKLAGNAPTPKRKMLRDGAQQPLAASAPASAMPPNAEPEEAASKAATASKPAITAAAPENPTGLRAALAQWGLAPQDADEIVEQLDVQLLIRAPLIQGAPSNHQPPAARPLTVWSCSVDADSLEHDRLGRVLAQHEVRVLEQRSLSLALTGATNAVSANPPAANPPATSPPASHAPAMAMLVAGSPDQLDAALADIRSRPDTFRQLTDLGRKSLGRAPGAEPAVAAGISKGRKLAPAQHAAQRVELFILRCAEPVSPASPQAPGPKASGKAAKLAPAEPGAGEK